MKLRKTAAAAAVAVAMGGGMAGQAHADAFAGAFIDISNFILTEAGGSPIDLVDFSSLSFTDTLTNTAQLQGVVDPDPTNTAVTVAFFTAVPPFSSGFVASTDATQACVGMVAGVPAPGGGACAAIPENTFTIVDPPPPNTVFARSDSVLQNQPIDGTGFPTGVRAATIAEASINQPSVFGSSNSNIQLTSSFQFVLAQPANTINIEFTADAFLQAWTGPGTTVPTQAGGSIVWQLGVQGPGVAISWTPGAGGPGGDSIGLNVTKQGCDLNEVTSAGPSQPNAPVINCKGGEFQAFAQGAFLAGTPYSLQITHSSSANALQTAAEPSSLLLLGLGFAGLGLARRYRKTA